MANIADATVKITAVKCGAELLEYIKLAQDNAYYNIVENGSELETQEEGDTLVIEGSASGRWSYHSNATRYFPHPDRIEDLRQWVGKEKADEVESSYRKLLDAIKSNEGSVRIEYGESECGMAFCGTGEITLVGQPDNTVEYSEIYEELPYDAKNVSLVHGTDDCYDCAKCSAVAYEIDECAICSDKVCEGCEMYSCKKCNADHCESCSITDSLGDNYCKQCYKTVV